MPGILHCQLEVHQIYIEQEHHLFENIATVLLYRTDWYW